MRHVTRNKNRDGFIAVTSAVVIGILLLSITLSLSLTGFFAQFNILDAEYKERSRSLAQACAGTALLKLAANPSYTGPETIPVGTFTCDIVSVVPNSGKFTIKTRASYPAGAAEQAVTNLITTSTISTLVVTGREEIPN